MSGWNHALHKTPRPEAWFTCSGGRPPCPAHAEYTFTYSYVTGRQGRVSFARKALCSEHAAKCAKRYGLELPTEDVAVVKHASELAVDQLLGGAK